MPILELQDFNIISPSPDNFILRLKVDGKDYNYIGSGEHVYQDVDTDRKLTAHESLVTAHLAHSSIFEYQTSGNVSSSVFAWDMFDINDVGVTTDADDENNDNLLLMQNSNIDPSAKTAIPMHQINSNSVYGYVQAIDKESIGVPKVDDESDNNKFIMVHHNSDPLTRYHYRPMAVALSGVLGLGDQMDFKDTFDKLFVFDPTDNNRLSFSDYVRSWRNYQSNRDKSTNKVTNNFDFGKLLVRTILFPKATLNNEYSTERQYTSISTPYAYMRKYAWDDEHFYSNGSFIVLNSREDNSFNNEKIDSESNPPGTMVTSKYSRRFGDVVPKLNEVEPPGNVTIVDPDNNLKIEIETDYNRVIQDISSESSDIFDNGSTFKQYMPESINRENETTSDTSLMTSKHKANIFDVDIKSFWNSLKTSINTVPIEVKSNIKDMIRKNLYEMIENIKPAHTKLYRVIINEEGDDVDTSSPYEPSDPTEKIVTLVFNANGGLYNNTSTTTAITGNVGDSVDDIPSPERLGYLFDIYNPEKPDTYPSSSTTYIAQWNPISYTVIFHSNTEETETSSSQTFTYDEKKNLDENTFENEGFRFIGWSTTVGGSIEYQNGQSVLNLASTNDATIDLYAVWTPLTYVATFKANDGTGTMPSQSFLHGVSQNLSRNRFKKDHYIFTKWIGSDGNTYLDEQDTMLTSDIDLSAQWNPSKYYVNFDGMGATSGTMERQEFIFGQPGYLTENNFQKEHYQFINWFDSTGRTYENQEEISCLSSNLNLYANWLGDDLEIRFHPGDEGVQGIMDSQHFNYGNSVTLNPNQYAKRHYKFYRWIDGNGLDHREYIDKETLNGLVRSIDLSATWDPKEYEISFNKNDVSATGEMSSVTLIYGDKDSVLPKNAFVKANYDFINWIDIDGYEYSDQQEMSAYNGEGGELSAQWAPAKYYAWFDGNGETSGSMDYQQFTYGIPQALYPNQFSRKNYTFRVWTGDNGKDYIDCEEIELSSDVVLEAQWDRISSTMTFYRYDNSDTIVTYRDKPYDSLVQYLEFEDDGTPGTRDQGLAQSIKQSINTQIFMARNRGYDAVLSYCSNESQSSSQQPPLDNGWIDTVGTKWDLTRATIYMAPSSEASAARFNLDYKDRAYPFTFTPNNNPNETDPHYQFDTTIPHNFGIKPINLTNGIYTGVMGYIEINNTGTSSIVTCDAIDFDTTVDNYIYIKPHGEVVHNGANKFRIHSLEIYEYESDGSRKTIFDGRPARLNGAGCMYDTISKRLFTNDGTKNIAYGEDISDEMLATVKKYHIVGELSAESIPDKEDAIKVEIGSLVSSIGPGAFKDCTNLLTALMPNNISSIEVSAYDGCVNLMCANIPTDISCIEKHTFNHCENLTSIVLPNGITSIGDNAFMFCTNLSAITIPNTVESIGNFAFQDCTSLPSFDIPTSVTSIGRAGLAWCRNLTTITIPNSISSLSRDVFHGCLSLESISLPSTISSINPGAFMYCRSLSSITCMRMMASSISEDAFGFNAENYTGRNTYDIPGNNALIIPQGATGYETAGTAWKDTLLDQTKCGFNINPKQYTRVKYTDASGLGVKWYSISGALGRDSIPNRAYAEEVKIGEYVTSINDGAFSGSLPEDQRNYILKSVYIPDTVSIIGEAAFAYCPNLTAVNIPNNTNLTAIYTHTFVLTGIKSISIPSTIISIGAGAFKYCHDLSSITCWRSTAPTLAGGSTFGAPEPGESDTTYTGRNTYATGQNVLTISSDATGYDAGAWADPLQVSSKCGFHIKYI